MTLQSPPQDPPPTPVTTTEALGAAVETLARAAYVCMDTEFERNRTYYPRLCLIQLAAPGTVFLIDPLAVEDLTALDVLLKAHDTLKVLHSARQDMEILLRHLGYPPRPLFDTQIAAAALGMGDQLGYGELVQRLLGVELEKGHARTDWCARPLSEAQRRYAAEDVIWLCPVYEALHEELRERGRLEWVLEDSARLADPGLYTAPVQEIWRRTRGMHTLRPERYTVLQALAAWREEQAMAHDLPRRWVVPDETLVTLAAHGDPATLHRAPGMNERRLRRWGPGLRKVLRNAGDSLGETPLANPGPLTPEQRATVQRALSEVRAQARRLGVTPGYLASRSQITRLVLGERVPELTHGWRAGILGELELLGPLVRERAP